LYVGATRFEDAEDRYQRAIRGAERIGDQKLLARSLQGLAAIFDTNGELDQAIDYYRRALHAADRAGDRRTVATAHFNLGALLVDEERDDEAREHLIRARDEAEAMHDFGLADRARTLLRILAPPTTLFDDFGAADMPIAESPVRPRIYPGLD
jgi:tetratricopeptide (TPR) repeat protein